MMSGLIDAFVDAKMKRIDVSLALYELSGELNSLTPIVNIARRTESEMKTMVLTTLPDADLDKLSFVILMAFSTMAGSAKAVLEKGATPALVRELRAALKQMCIAYVTNELDS